MKKPLLYVSLLVVGVTVFGMHTVNNISTMEKPDNQGQKQIFVTTISVRQKEVVPPKDPIPKGYFRRWTAQKGFQLIPIPKGENWWGN